MLLPRVTAVEDSCWIQFTGRKSAAAAAANTAYGEFCASWPGHHQPMPLCRYAGSAVWATHFVSRPSMMAFGVWCQPSLPSMTGT